MTPNLTYYKKCTANSHSNMDKKGSAVGLDKLDLNRWCVG